eukprot:CAMPEP_0175241304 /NCGR_PEP_ID=MMETSP0093-20121207/30493_1 /TAXON_ID=311494 /ORGANISM="Alexandrium monilatum, Strain CCMP3105" /LENGTH=120 /DNA_ID=CAMNT_0016535363 /DNA_START=153 /DNA_END=516 /DNA_ORIENTATION=-
MAGCRNSPRLQDDPSRGEVVVVILVGEPPDVHVVDGAWLETAPLPAVAHEHSLVAAGEQVYLRLHARHELMQATTKMVSGSALAFVVLEHACEVLGSFCDLPLQARTALSTFLAMAISHE